MTYLNGYSSYKYKHEVEKPKILIPPSLYFKIRTFAHAGDTEVGGMCRLLHNREPAADRKPGEAPFTNILTAFDVLKQKAGGASFEFDNEAMDDYVLEMDALAEKKGLDLADLGVGRVMLHTHPGEDPTPSVVDEKEFDEKYGGCAWAIMLIMAVEGKENFYGRLRCNLPFEHEVECDVVVYWDLLPAEFGGKWMPHTELEPRQWLEQHKQLVSKKVYKVVTAAKAKPEKVAGKGADKGADGDVERGMVLNGKEAWRQKWRDRDLTVQEMEELQEEIALAQGFDSGLWDEDEDEDAFAVLEVDGAASGAGEDDFDEDDFVTGTPSRSGVVEE